MLIANYFRSLSLFFVGKRASLVRFHGKPTKLNQTKCKFERKILKDTKYYNLIFNHYLRSVQLNYFILEIV